MSYYDTDEIYHQVGDLTKEVMAKFDVIERKLDDLIALRDNENLIEFHALQLNDRFASVFRTPSGTFGLLMKEGGKVVGKELFPGKSESYAENAAENFVHGIKNVWDFYCSRISINISGVNKDLIIDQATTPQLLINTVVWSPWRIYGKE